MKATVEKIVTAYMAVKNFNDKVPSTLAFRLGRFEDKTISIVKSFEKANAKLFKEYGEQIEGQPEGSLKIKKEVEDKYNEEIRVILDQEEEVDYSINLSLFEGVDVSKNFFVAMGDFIKE